MWISCKACEFPFGNLDNNGLAIDNDCSNLEDLDISLSETDKKTLKLISSLILENTEPENTNKKFCKYYTIRKFCRSKFEKNNLSIFHLNIASLQYHFDDLLYLLNTLDFTFDILAFSETKIKTDDKPRQIKENFYDIMMTPTKAEKGGTVIYAAKHLYPKPRNDLEITESKKIESTFIEIQTEKSKSFIIGCVYKHHNIEIKEFSDSINHTMKKINQEKKLAYITGDFNVNLLQIEHNKDIANHYDQISNNNFLPLITLPTRITSRSKTLIDNILTNNFNKEIKSGNLTVNISDHMPQFAFIPVANKNYIPEVKHFVRDTKNLDMNKLIDEIRTLNYDYTHAGNCINTDTKRFISDTNKVIDKHAPIKKITNKELKEKMKPWITNGIRSHIKQRNNLFNKLKKESEAEKKDELKTKIKIHRNKIKHLLRDSKSSYYKSYFKNNADNIRNLWKGINEIISNRKNNRDGINCIETKEDNKTSTITDSKIIANKFNKYFTNIAEKILKTRKYNGNKAYDQYLENHNKRFKITPTNSTEVMEIIKQLNPKTGTGPNSIPSFILRKISFIIATPISNLCNRSLEIGQYPDILKMARVVPVHKKESKLNIENYRPISLLSNINKIFEKTMCLRIRNHFERNNLLYSFQFGFRQNHSTNHAVLMMVQKIQEQIKRNNIAIGVFIDLQKAFDTVNHDILLNKLDSYGICGISKKWLKSYLTNRQQFVSINGQDSDNEFILHGVPQGSVLGPLLFTIYVNDMHRCIKNSTTFHFADDTNLLYIPKKKLRNRNIVRLLNKDLKVLNNWLKANKISLNSSKTKLIVFRKKTTQIPYIKVKLDGVRLLPTNSVKYLGVHIDENLSFDTHIQLLNAKLRRANNILAISRHYVPTANLMQIYHGQFHSHLMYCCQVWGQNDNKLAKTITLQKKAIRLMSFAENNTHSSPLFKQLNLLKLSDIIKINNVFFVHKALNRNLPNIFDDCFKKIEETNRYSTTRNPSSLCSIPLGSLQLTQQTNGTIQHNCAVDWNKVLKKLSNTTSLTDWMANMSEQKLKSCIKEHLLAAY